MSDTPLTDALLGNPAHEFVKGFREIERKLAQAKAELKFWSGIEFLNGNGQKSPSAFHDLPALDVEGKCSLCSADLPAGSPWTLCFDPEWKCNIWGSDTFEQRAQLCQCCAEKLIRRD